MLSISRDIGSPRCEIQHTWQKLPLELIERILSNLDAQSCRNFRLSCKHLARMGRSSLCRIINVTETPESFQRLLKICRQGDEIAKSIRILNYIPFTLQSSRISPNHWRIVDQTGCLGPIKPDNYYATFDEYDGLLEDRRKLAQTAENVEYFIQALRYIKPIAINIFDLTIKAEIPRIYQITHFSERCTIECQSGCVGSIGA